MKPIRSGLVALTLVFGCLTVGANALAAQKEKQSRDRNLITRQELLQSAQNSRDLYQAILSLRPHFIAPLPLRTSGSAAERARRRTPQVYVDGNLSGGLDVLRSILAENVDEVKYMGPTEAALEFGPEAGGGALLVKLHKQPKP